MKKLILLIAALLWTNLVYACDRLYPIELIRILDGDTIEARILLGFDITMTKKIRIADLDTPETFRPRNENELAHGMEAKELAAQLLVGDLKLISCGYGVYSRVIGDIVLQDGRDFATIMKQSGMEKRKSYADTKD